MLKLKKKKNTVENKTAMQNETQVDSADNQENNTDISVEPNDMKISSEDKSGSEEQSEKEKKKKSPVKNRQKRFFHSKDLIVDERLQERLNQALADTTFVERKRKKDILQGHLENGKLTEEGINDLLLYSNEWLNIKSITNGIIETFDNRYIKIIEIEPITFLMRAPDEQWDIIVDFYSWLKVAPVKLQFRVETTNANTDTILTNFKNSLDKETNPMVRERGEEMVRHIRYTSKQQALQKRFYIIYEYEGVDGVKSNNTYEIYAEMQAVKNSIAAFFGVCGNQVIEHDDTMFVAEMLYRALNPKSCKTEPFQSRIDRVAKDNFMLSLKHGENVDYASIDDRMYFSPRGLDFTNPRYSICDGMYVTHLYIKANGYRHIVYPGWFEELTGHGKDVTLNMYSIKKDRMASIDRTMHISRFRRSQSRDSFRRREDAEEFQKTAATADSIRRQMSEQNEDLYDVYVQLTIMNESLKELNKRKREIKQKLRSRDIETDECLMYQEQAFIMSLPLLDIQKQLFTKAKRNFLTSSLASTYMFTAFSLYSDEGICLGVEGVQHSLVVYDPFDKSRFSNGNCVIAGTPGMGKTFLLMSMAYAFRLKGLPVFVILPEKGHEWKRALVPAMGGQYIELAPGSKDCINILAIKPPKKSALADEEESNASLLSKKIHQVITFIQLSMPKDRMDDDEEAAISTVLTKMYEYFGITTDNDSIYADTEKGILKPMPIMEDFYYRAVENEVLSRRICQIINIYVNGDASNMNGQTNVDLSNPFTVISVSLAGKRMLAPFSFLTIDLCYDTIKADLTENCVLVMDEVWKMMANRYASEYVDEIYRICRGYGCAAVSATQKCDDLFNNEYGTSIMDNARIKFILGMEKKQADALENMIYLTPNDKKIITSQGQGQAMLFANNDKLQILIHSPHEWGPLFETDVRKLKALLENGHFDNLFHYIKN